MAREAVVDTALNGLLQSIVSGWGNTLRAHLFVNNRNPTIHDTLADYTQASFPGYGSIPITGWTSPSTATSLASSNADRVTFVLSTSGGPYPVYGYYVTSAGGALLWAARDPSGPVFLAAADEEYPVVPVFTLRSQT